MVILCGFVAGMNADFSEEEAKELAKRAAKIRAELKLDKPPLTEKEKRIMQIRKELDIPYTETLKVTQSQSVGTKTVKSIVVERKSSGKMHNLSEIFINIKKSFSGDKEDEGFSFYKSIGMKEGAYWGMPSLFGWNEKKEESMFGLDTLTDIKTLGSSLYKGMKHSGESAEFMSGVMYYNAKMYNMMFGVFDDSPLNIFEDKEEDSILDVFEKGNEILDIFK